MPDSTSQPAAEPSAVGPAEVLRRLIAASGRGDRVTHVERVPPREGRTARWPSWVPPLLVDRLGLAGVPALWTHQAQAAAEAWSGRSVVISTGTASGKSLAYLLPVLSAVLTEGRDPGAGAPTALYLAPTKALAADQLRTIRGLLLAEVRAATYDGDTPAEERSWVRAHANLVLTNPDMLHRSLLPAHHRWAGFLRRLRFVVVDECHGYRGVFGSHVAHVLRRLRRVCARYGASPVFVLASATVADPAGSASRLTGLDVMAVTDDGSPRGSTDFVLWEPPLTARTGEHGAPVRRPATAEAADLLADLVSDGVRTLTFVRSRRAAETVALAARRRLAEVDSALVDRVAAYRAGYLPEDRRALEAALQSGQLLGTAATTALELGMDIAGLDAVVLAGYPGTLASTWQQAGRAGRGRREALAVLLARDDPLDSYLVHHPEALFGRPVEASVFDPDNPYVLGPHLCCAAGELPLQPEDLPLFGGRAAEDLLPDLVRRGLLRRRSTGWYWTSRQRAADSVDLRGVGAPPVRVVEADTGRLLGTVDGGAAHHAVHRGAVYLHQGDSYLVRQLDLEQSVALVEPAEPDYATVAREVTDIRVTESLSASRWPDLELHFGTVEVTSQVVSFLRRRLGSGEPLGEVPLDLPPRQLRTRAVWYVVDEALLARAGFSPAELPGAAHAAEHAAIGLLPLFAICDRWDIGGVSTARHVDTGQLSVFVYDGHPGGAGMAERGYRRAQDWLAATRMAISSCACAAGCPSCVQSPKCGNGNQPLDKAGAVRLLDAVLAAGLAAAPGVGSRPQNGHAA